MNGYLSIWNSFIKWKNEDDFIYDESEYSKFLLDCYHFDITTYNNKTKSYFQELIRSKRRCFYIFRDFLKYLVNYSIFKRRKN